MNKIRAVLTLILSIFAFYSFAETAENKSDLILYPYLTIQEIDEDGQDLVLDDGSEWEVKYFGGIWRLLGWGWVEQKKISHWTCGDVIEVRYPQGGNLASFFLFIRNISRNEMIVTELKRPPSVDHPACLWVVDYNERTHYLILNDGTAWLRTKINMNGTSFHSSSSQGKWKMGDPITLIKTEGWPDNLYMWNHSTNDISVVKCLGVF